VVGIFVDPSSKSPLDVSSGCTEYATDPTTVPAALKVF